MYTDWPDCNDPRQMRAQSLTSEKKGAEALWRQEKRHRARPSPTTLPRLPFLVLQSAHSQGNTALAVGPCTNESFILVRRLGLRVSGPHLVDG